MPKRTEQEAFDSKLQEMRNALKIDRNSLDTEQERQPEIFNEAGELAALSRSKMDEAKSNKDRIEAEVESEYRKKHSKDEKAITDKAIKAKVETDERVLKADRIFLRHKRNTDLVEALKASWHQRNYMLRELSSLYIAGYFQSHSAGASGAKANEVRTSRAEKNKDRMAEKRRNRLGKEEED